MLTRLGVPGLWRDDPERFWEFARAFLTGFLRRVAPTYAYGIERIPRTGGAVIAANHFGTVDPPLIGIHSTRTIYYMSKVELLEIPIAGEILRWTGAFAVRRGESDRDAIRLARWLAREGHVVGMFMEGTRQRFGYPGPVHPGAVMIAIQEGVPIVPCGRRSWGGGGARRQVDLAPGAAAGRDRRGRERAAPPAPRRRHRVDDLGAP